MPFGLQHRNIDDNQSQQQWQNIFKVLVAAGWSFLLKDAKNFKLDVDLLVIVQHNASMTNASDVESHKNIIYFQLELQRDGWQKVCSRWWFSDNWQKFLYANFSWFQCALKR